MNWPRHPVSFVEERLAVWRVAILLVLFGAGASLAQENPQPLIREAVENELRIAKTDTSLWRYAAEVQTNGKEELRDVIQSQQGSLYRVLAVNGRPFSADERRQDDARIASILKDKRLQHKLAKESQHDDEQKMRLFKLIPKLFLFEEVGHEGKLVRVRFNPNPQFHARKHDSQVFHAMAGTMLIESEQKRLLELSGIITRELKFGGGIFGHVGKGGHFDVRQTQVAPETWAISYRNTQIDGRIPFRKPNTLHEMESRSKFQRLPDHLTLAQAGEMLMQSEAAPRATTSQ